MKPQTLPEETTERRVLRLTLGIGGALVFVQFFPWPIAFEMPLFVGMLLQEPRPMSYGAGLQALLQATFAMVAGYLVATTLEAYPFLVMGALLALLWRLYVFMLTAGTSAISLVGAIIGLLVVPVMVPISPELARGVAIGLATNLLVAFVVAQAAFLLVPARHVDRPEPTAVPSMVVARGLALKMTVAMGPILIVFLLYGLTDILLLSVAAMVALGMGGQKSWEIGIGQVTANLLYGGLGMLIVYQVSVIAPNPVIFAVTAFAVTWFFAHKIFRGGARAALWATALNGYLLLVGSVVGAEDVASIPKLLDRVGQFLIATLYVTFAYNVVDFIVSFWPSKVANSPQ